MSCKKRNHQLGLSLRLTKRRGGQPGAENPLLKLIPNVSVETEISSYSEHTQWEYLESEGSRMAVFEKWYNENSAGYNHARHAFNSMCKHYGLIEIKKAIVRLERKRLSTLWSFKSFNDRVWIYQDTEGELKTVATKSGGMFELKDEELEPIARLIEIVCA